jgi:hypothetical protein
MTVYLLVQSVMFFVQQQIAMQDIKQVMWEHTRTYKQPHLMNINQFLSQIKYFY